MEWRRIFFASSLPLLLHSRPTKTPYPVLFGGGGEMHIPSENMLQLFVVYTLLSWERFQSYYTPQVKYPTRATKTEIRVLLFGLFCKHVDMKYNIYSQGIVFLRVRLMAAFQIVALVRSPIFFWKLGTGTNCCIETIIILF